MPSTSISLDPDRIWRPSSPFRSIPIRSSSPSTSIWARPLRAWRSTAPATSTSPWIRSSAFRSASASIRTCPWDSASSSWRTVTPEVTLNASAAIDNPNITGKVADVFKVRLQEDATVAPNQGIALTSTVHVNLVDPTTGPQADGRITLDEFSPSALSDMFRADIEGALDIDGLTLAADLSGASLGTLKISIDGTTDGHIDSIDDLTALLSRIKVEGNLGLPEDIPIPAFVRDAILQGLLTVVQLDRSARRHGTVQAGTAARRHVARPGARLADAGTQPALRAGRCLFRRDTTPTVGELVTALRHQFADLGFGGEPERAGVRPRSRAERQYRDSHRSRRPGHESRASRWMARPRSALDAGLRFVSAADESKPKFAFGVDLTPGIDLERCILHTGRRSSWRPDRCRRRTSTSDSKPVSSAHRSSPAAWRSMAASKGR